jgi:hypothetical protein
MLIDEISMLETKTKLNDDISICGENTLIELQYEMQ